MSLPEITITTGQVIESTIIYGCVHTIWTCIKWGIKHLETDTGRIINRHVKDGHHKRLTRCFEASCIKLRTVSGSPHQEAPQLEPAE